MAGRTRKIISAVMAALMIKAAAAVIRKYPHPLITAGMYLRQRIMAT